MGWLRRTDAGARSDCGRGMSLLVATRRTLIAAKQVWDFAAGMPSGASILRSGGNATYFDVAGVLQVASGSDTARRNYNPATLAFEGLYIEAAATNLLRQVKGFLLIS